jgi:hypothetical protein
VRFAWNMNGTTTGPYPCPGPPLEDEARGVALGHAPLQPRVRIPDPNPPLGLRPRLFFCPVSL